MLALFFQLCCPFATSCRAWLRTLHHLQHRRTPHTSKHPWRDWQPHLCAHACAPCGLATNGATCARACLRHRFDADAAAPKLGELTLGRGPRYDGHGGYDRPPLGGYHGAYGGAYPTSYPPQHPLYYGTHFGAGASYEEVGLGDHGYPCHGPTAYGVPPPPPPPPRRPAPQQECVPGSNGGSGNHSAGAAPNGSSACHGREGMDGQHGGMGCTRSRSGSPPPATGAGCGDRGGSSAHTARAACAQGGWPGEEGAAHVPPAQVRLLTRPKGADGLAPGCEPRQQELQHRPLRGEGADEVHGSGVVGDGCGEGGAGCRRACA